MKKFMKVMLCIVGGSIVLAAVLWLCLDYVSNYQKTTCDTSVSPDGQYELLLQAVGEPDWPFGSASGRLLLKKDGKKIGCRNFELKNDGAPIGKSCWTVTWYDDYVEVVLSAKEQGDEKLVMDLK